VLISPPEDSGFITLANFERGVYEPSDEVKVYDGSEEEEDVEGSRLPLLIVLALLVLAMFGGVVWLAYTQGVARGRGETPVLAAAVAPNAWRRRIPAAAMFPIRVSRFTSSPRHPMTAPRRRRPLLLLQRRRYRHPKPLNRKQRSPRP